MTDTEEPIRREIVVAARAFALLTDETTSWWPPAHHIGSAPIAEVVVEPRSGGRCFTRHQDGTETSTGAVRPATDAPGSGSSIATSTPSAPTRANTSNADTPELPGARGEKPWPPEVCSDRVVRPRAQTRMGADLPVRPPTTP